jgi:NTP pyrophosphatase (non-canonical NTP hydrolase)
LNREEIFQAIEIERERQDRIHPMPQRKKHDDKDVDAVANLLMLNEFLAVLIEEVGEVGSALQGDGNLKEELIQVASVCVRFLEELK